jgi:hypothetical protein
MGGGGDVVRPRREADSKVRQNGHQNTHFISKNLCDKNVKLLSQIRVNAIQICDFLKLLCWGSHCDYSPWTTENLGRLLAVC